MAQSPFVSKWEIRIANLIVVESQECHHEQYHF